MMKILNISNRYTGTTMMQREREPFFKPLNVNDGTMEMSINSQKGRLKQFSAEKAKQQEEEDVSDEKLTFLHVKLHQEADKIRKWKNQTEFDIKQKDQKIQEATQTIESLRKSILDLQIQNESLSLTLNDELGNQNEIFQSVASTRKLCSVLKDHMERTDSKLINCEAEKTELRYLEQEHKKQLEILSNKYKALEENKLDLDNKFETEILTLKEENTKAKQQLQQKLKETENELILLQKKCDEKDIEIRDIRKEVQKNQEKIHTYEKTVDMLNDNLKSTEEELSKTQDQYKESCSMYETVQLNKSSIEEKLKETEIQIETLVCKYSTLQIDHQTSKESHSCEMLDAQKKIEEGRQHLSEKEEKIQNLESDLDKTILMLEEVKSSKDMLIMEKAALENRLKDLELQNVELLSQQEQNCHTISQMSMSIDDLQNQLSVSQEEGAAMVMQLNDFRAQMSSLEKEKLLLGERMNSLEGDVTSKKSSLGELQKQLDDKSQQIEALKQELQSLQECLLLEQENHGNTNSKLNDTEKKLEQVHEEVKAKTKELKTLHKELDSMSKQNKSMNVTMEKNATEENKLREEIAELQSELELQKETNDSLMEERQQNDEAIQGKLQSKDKETTDLESKNKAMKSDITVKNKQIKELEKEIKGMKSKVTSATKTCDKKSEEVEKLEAELASQTSEREKLLEQMQDMEKQIEKVLADSEEAERKANEMKDFSDKCLGEKEVMGQQCEQMRSEMSSIMQNYKSENDTLVAKKDTEISTLKTKLQQATKSAQKEVVAEIETLKKENEHLRKAVSESGYEMENLQKTYGMKENEVMELNKENNKKNEELKDLQLQLEKMALKPTINTVVQTSPFPDKTYQHSYSRPTTPKEPPRTPKVNPIRPSSAITPICKQTPRLPRTPTSELKTPQRSILKTMATNSALKKRRVVFATKDDDDSSVDSDSATFEVVDPNDGRGTADCSTPLLLKPSPRFLSVEKTRQDSICEETQPYLPLTRMPRGPPVSQEKKKPVKEKPSSVRKAPKKESGKFFKTSPKSKMAKLREKEDMSWFERDDIFGFTAED